MTKNNVKMTRMRPIELPPLLSLYAAQYSDTIYLLSINLNLSLIACSGLFALKKYSALFDSIYCKIYNEIIYFLIEHKKIKQINSKLKEKTIHLESWPTIYTLFIYIYTFLILFI